MVRINLGQVGLTHSQASAYLPAGKTVICHAGPHHAQTRMEVPLFSSTKLGQLPACT